MKEKSISHRYRRGEEDRGAHNRLNKKSESGKKRERDRKRERGGRKKKFYEIR